MQAKRHLDKEVISFLKAERERQGLNYAQVAERAGLDPSTVFKIEQKGTGALGSVLLIAQALGVDAITISKPPDIIVPWEIKNYLLDPTKTKQLLEIVRTIEEIKASEENLKKVLLLLKALG